MNVKTITRPRLGIFRTLFPYARSNQKGPMAGPFGSVSRAISGRLSHRRGGTTSGAKTLDTARSDSSSWRIESAQAEASAVIWWPKPYLMVIPWD